MLWERPEGFRTESAGYDDYAPEYGEEEGAWEEEGHGEWQEEHDWKEESHGEWHADENGYYGEEGGWEEKERGEWEAGEGTDGGGGGGGSGGVDNWQQHFDEGGNEHWYNATTGESHYGAWVE